MKIVIYLILSVGVIASIIYVMGMFIPEERIVKRSIIVKAPIEKVWRTVTDIENQPAWRNDLDEVKIIENSKSALVWVEYPKKGSPITFREKAKTPYSRYEIEIVPGGFFSGYWVGMFSEVDEGVKLEFTEVGKIHSPIVRVLAYFFFDLEQTIEEYQRSLKNYLEGGG